MKVEFFAEAKLILIWGSNAIASSVHFWRLAQQAKRAGARLVCIDPRRSETAEKCHDHLALRPGTDAALALALMHELIVHDWLDHDYLAQHTLGWEGLRERALRWSPERAAAVCGLAVDQIRELARHYGTTPTRGDPPQLRYAARAWRGERSACDRLPACAHRSLAASCRWFAVVQFRPLSLRQGTAAAAGLARRQGAPHPQHGHHRRRPAPPPGAGLRPAD
jgi:hypothetical protein